MVVVRCEGRDVVEIITNVLLTGLTVCQTELQVADGLNILQESLFFHAPSESCCREVAPLMTLGEARRTVGTHGEREEVAVQQRVVQTADPRAQAVL